nr:MAG TPA: hypothetical protein [Caudoviricetes sp.]
MPSYPERRRIVFTVWRRLPARDRLLQVGSCGVPHREAAFA